MVETTQATIASFNVKNLIGPDQEYYRFQRYTPEEYAWKKAWLADQLVRMDSDVIAFQEIFDEAALRDVIAEADRIGAQRNDISLPPEHVGYARKFIFKTIRYDGYAQSSLAFAPNVNDGGPGERRPGLAVLSRFGFVGTPEIIQDLAEPVDIPFSELGGAGSAGSFRLSRLSRPILKCRIPMHGQTVTVLNCHLKSKLGEWDRPDGAAFPPAADLTQFDPVGRALGALRAGLRRMAEAWVLRREAVAALDRGEPVIVLGDINDGEHSVTTEIIRGEAAFKDYRFMLRHDAQTPRDRYTSQENEQIQVDVARYRLHAAETLFVRQSQRDMVYTTNFGGVYESIDQIFLSAHFHPDNPDHRARLSYFSVLNDHISDGSHAEAPYIKLLSDHGQIVAQLTFPQRR